MKAEIYSEAEKHFLLRLARQTIEQKLSDPCTKKETELFSDEDLTESVQKKAGAFVTLKMLGSDELRGCIGHIEPFLPLYQTIMENAVSAATRDPRFSPVAKNELPDIRIEISVMGPLMEMKTPEEICVGVHGLVISRGMARGLLLPQVAVEWNWSREEFLAHTCQKAGLPLSAWKEPGTHLQIFTCCVFQENE